MYQLRLTREQRLDHLMSGYATHFTAATDAEPTDAAIAETLANCARKPKPEWYGEIRAHVHIWREVGDHDPRTCREAP
jgi:hypothetical protein